MIRLIHVNKSLRAFWYGDSPLNIDPCSIREYHLIELWIVYECIPLAVWKLCKVNKSYYRFVAMQLLGGTSCLLGHTQEGLIGGFKTSSQALLDHFSKNEYEDGALPGWGDIRHCISPKDAEYISALNTLYNL